MHLSLCACMHALACVCMYTGDHAPRIFSENTSLRLQSEVKLIITINLHLLPAIQLTLCVHPSMHVSVSVCAYMHVSVHNIMCSAGPEVAFLD